MQATITDKLTNSIVSSQAFRAKLDPLIAQFTKELTLVASNHLIQGNYAKSSIGEIVELLIQEGINRRASDIHIEPQEQAVAIRLRIDGMLHQLIVLPKQLHGYIISYIKLQAHLDISEKRIPQDGSILLPEEELDLRVSILPVLDGEKMVIRILGKAGELRKLADVGFSEQDYELYEEMINTTGGLVIITGPVNSGKSTLLYATLDYLNTETRNIITIEDPVEIKLPGVNQLQVNAKAGMTYEVALRAILRQDPNVVMIGEIRDEVVAKEALRAALTGHLVLTTVHTNDAKGVVGRLQNMGIPGGLLALALRGCTAQRLVRKICPYCKEKMPVDKLKSLPYLSKVLGENFKGEISCGKGCGKCRGSGYLGRVPIYEILSVDEMMRLWINEDRWQEEICGYYQQKRLSTMLEDGRKKIALGLTTPQEIWRVLNGISELT